MALLKLRRHTYFIDCDTIEVKEIVAGRFSVTVDNREAFTVSGGRAGGGTARVRAFFAHEIEQGVSRKEAIARAVAQGYAYCTARTQYQIVFQGA